MSHLSAPILIAGGTGFIGTRLIKHFAHLGYQNVSILTRDTAKAAATLQKFLQDPTGVSNLKESRYKPGSVCSVKFLTMGSLMQSLANEGAGASSGSTKQLFVKSNEDSSKLDIIDSGLWAGLKEAENTNDDSKTPKIIINLTGENLNAKRWNDKVRNEIYDSRVNATRDLVTYAKKLSEMGKPVKVFVQGSAIGYYGNERTEDFTESDIAVGNYNTTLGTTLKDKIPHSDLNPGDFATRVVQDWELEALKLFINADTARGGADKAIENKFSNETVMHIIRTGVVCGKGGGAIQEMLLPFQFGLGSSLGDGGQWMSWIHMRDHIGAVDFLIEKSYDDGGKAFSTSSTQSGSGQAPGLDSAQTNEEKLAAMDKKHPSNIAKFINSAYDNTAQATVLLRDIFEAAENAAGNLGNAEDAEGNSSTAPSINSKHSFYYTPEKVDSALKSTFVWNLTAPQPRTNKEFSRDLAEALGRPMFLSLPGVIAKTMFGQAAEAILLEAPCVVPRNLQKAGFEFQFPNCLEAMKDVVDK